MGDSAGELSEHEQTQRALRESEARFAAFMDNLPGAAWIKDLDGRYVYANREAERIFSVSKANLYGKTDEEVFPPETARQFRENDRRVIDTGRAIQQIEVLRQADGVDHHSIVSKFPVEGPSGQRAYVGGVAFDVTEQKRAEGALQDANRRKDLFLATLAHELRNPLAAIRAAAQIIERFPPVQADARWAVGVVQRQEAQLTRLVDDLLDVARIARGRMQLRTQTLNLATAVSGAVETVRGLIDERTHELVVSLSDRPLYVDGDLARLTQVFANLLNNAAKFQDAGGRISLTCEPDGREAVVRVRDAGIGISADVLPHIFDLAAGGDFSRTRHGGLGIGLSLVRGLVELHGGRVHAYSAGHGQGSEFVVRLPAVAAPTVANGHTTGDAPAAGAQRIVVVDDNADAADSMARLLRMDGHETHVAYTGTAALELAARLSPSVLLVDIGLPDMDGFELARRLRGLDGLRTARLVAVTGHGQAQDVQQAHAAGFNAHLVKPVNLDKLHQILADTPSPDS